MSREAVAEARDYRVLIGVVHWTTIEEEAILSDGGLVQEVTLQSQESLPGRRRDTFSM